MGQDHGWSQDQPTSNRVLQGPGNLVHLKIAYIQEKWVTPPLGVHSSKQRALFSINSFRMNREHKVCHIIMTGAPSTKLYLVRLPLGTPYGIVLR
jgi:hypothetical protein